MTSLSLTRLWPWLFAGLFLGGIAHIVSILLMPRLSGQDATTKLRALGPLNQVQGLQRDRPDKALIPFNDPNVALGICPFDISNAPLRIKVVPGEQFLTLAFLQPGGSVFYSLSDRTNPKGSLDVRLVNSDQLQRIEANDPEDQPIAELRVKAPSSTGVVLLRSLASDASQLRPAEQRIAKASCALEPIQK